jgi:8-oxo-dGTP diphosphatase
VKRPATIRDRHSAGGVIFRRRAGRETDVAMIAVKNGTVWALPKGLIDPGESPEETAVREVREETGLTGSIIGEIGNTTYWFHARGENVKCHKTVTYFLMRYEEGSTADHDHEVDRVVWVPLHEAEGRATYKGDREIIKKAMEMMDGE